MREALFSLMTEGEPFLASEVTVAYTVVRERETFPNNGSLPLLVYRDALRPADMDPAGVFVALFASNGWGGAWLNGVYDYHHYHSTAHEVLGVVSGSARLRFGGPGGPIFAVGRGDVVVIPAGVSHKNLGGEPGFQVVGAYPDGQVWDLGFGKPGERPDADRNIAAVDLPRADPLYGVEGPLNSLWSETELPGQ